MNDSNGGAMAVIASCAVIAVILLAGIFLVNGGSSFIGSAGDSLGGAANSVAEALTEDIPVVDEDGVVVGVVTTPLSLLGDMLKSPWAPWALLLTCTFFLLLTEGFNRFIGFIYTFCGLLLVTKDVLPWLADRIWDPLAIVSLTVVWVAVLGLSLSFNSKGVNEEGKSTQTSWPEGVSDASILLFVVGLVGGFLVDPEFWLLSLTSVVTLLLGLLLTKGEEKDLVKLEEEKFKEEKERLERVRLEDVEERASWASRRVVKE